MVFICLTLLATGRSDPWQLQMGHTISALYDDAVMLVAGYGTASAQSRPKVESKLMAASMLKVESKLMPGWRSKVDPKLMAASNWKVESKLMAGLREKVDD